MLARLDSVNRRKFLLQCGLAYGAGSSFLRAAAETAFEYRYLVGSSMYGDLNLAEILPEVSKSGAEYIDLWPRRHGTQREQVEEMGHEAFAALLEKTGVKLGCSTRYDLGPFKLQDEMQFVSKFGGDLLVCGGKGPKDLKGEELKAAVKDFAEQLKPHAEAAGTAKVQLGIENHGNNLIDSPDSLKWLAEFTPPEIGIALAPYHLEVLGLGAPELASLIEALGDRTLIFYAWQHGMGCTEKLPKEQELLQMPGRGDLDFGPLVTALKKIDYQGYTEIFMHPVPRGIPILPTATETTTEINRSRAYLENLL